MRIEKGFFGGVGNGGTHELINYHHGDKGHNKAHEEVENVVLTAKDIGIVNATPDHYLVVGIKAVHALAVIKLTTTISTKEDNSHVGIVIEHLNNAATAFNQYLPPAAHIPLT